MWKILILSLMFCPSIVQAQAVWRGHQYNGRVCSNPNCSMCASIQRQIESQQQPVLQVQMAAPLQNWMQSPQQAFRTETTMEARSKQVRHCDGRKCWYETVTEMVPVTRQVPIFPPPVASTPTLGTATQPGAAPPAVNMLANTELVPTPQAVVNAMLYELCPGNKEKLFDLGSGDGRIVISAAKQFGCTAVGIELNPETIELARANALEEYVNPLVVFFQGDVRNYDLHSAQYVTMYLYPELMAQIMPKIKSGTAIASYQHEIPGVENVKHEVDVNGQPHIFFTGIKL